MCKLRLIKKLIIVNSQINLALVLKFKFMYSLNAQSKIINKKIYLFDLWGVIHDGRKPYDKIIKLINHLKN